VLRTGSEADFRLALDQGSPAIVFLMTGDLPCWSANTAHAVVAGGYDDHLVFLNDPMFDEAPQRVGWNDFMPAWSEQDYFFALISN
jgi:hypothetical protein